ncbi:uncharacterized protein LOC115920658 [Strongylocentrotus purpuratus]|uniref:Uncharacterized protein n=1 Tax=Strongylocentrotus purpuratus TaxID=7668 RepID=A0A7M7N8S1_STRPU|nr:uncharacterized protein LOC115920658 [Strongylocentrotus purpuratus]
MEVRKKEKDKLSSKIKTIQKDKKELENQLTAVNEEKEHFQSRADRMEEGRDDLSAQLSETRKQYQELDEGFAAVYAEKQELHVRTISLENEKDELSAQLRFSLCDDDDQQINGLITQPTIKLLSSFFIAALSVLRQMATRMGYGCLWIIADYRRCYD